MAIQDGVFQIKGRIGNLSFYKTRDGYMVRKKTTLSADRVKSEPAFARTRENASEFGRAARAGKLLRTSFHTPLLDTSDNRVTSRLAGAMVRVLRENAIHSRGDRSVTDGDMTLLEGFEFNRHAKLSKTFAAPFNVAIDRTAGSMVVSIPAFNQEAMINAPDGATHFRLKASGASIDFEAYTYSVAVADSADLVLTDKIQEPLQLSLTIPPGSANPLFLIFGIEFIQIIKSGKAYPMSNGEFNAMAIVKVDQNVTRSTLPG